MRIAHVCPFYTPAIGGVKQVVEELAKRQVAQGHQVHIYTSDWDKEQRIRQKEEVIEGIIVHRCYHYFKIANFASFWPSVFTKLLDQELDVIHSHLFGHPHLVFASLAAKLKGIPHIHTTHCPWTDANRSTPGRMGVILSYNVFSRMALSLSRACIAITPWEKKFIKKFGGKNIQVIPNGMADEFFQKITPNTFRKKHGILQNTKIVLFFGRLSVTKSPDDVVRVAKKMLGKKEYEKNLVFVIRGPDEGLKKKVKELIGDEKRILLLPPTTSRKDIVEMYQAADVFLLPSFREGLPLTLFEAMASGLPIVATPVNGIPFEMEDEKNGFLVRHGDIQGFAEKINLLLKNEKLSKSIRENNLAKAQKYRWDDIAKRTEVVYVT